MADWLRNVVQEEDYNVGLKLQQGLETGLMKSVLFGRNERGNQYFHRWVKWYSDGDTKRSATRTLSAARIPALRIIECYLHNT